MNSQNFTKVSKLQQTPKTELLRAKEHQLSRELTDIQLQNDCFDVTQPRIMLDSSQLQDKHPSTENLCLDSMSKALREENIKSAPDEEAVTTQIADLFIEKSSKLPQNCPESLASDKDCTLGVNISELLDKFKQYQEKIVNDSMLERT